MQVLHRNGKGGDHPREGARPRVDVYKRQIVNGDNMMIGANAVMIKDAPFGSVPVSYTHLDVYKRQEYRCIIQGDRAFAYLGA